VKNAICHSIIIFFLYLSGAVRFKKKYVTNTVILVAKNVITDNTRGKIELSSQAQVLADENVFPTFKKEEIVNTRRINIIDQTIHAINAQRDIIHKSFNSNFCGPKLIIIFYF